MSLIKKSVTPQVLAANRGNSKKSTGPKSMVGKRRASGNAGKYYVYSQVTPERMRQLNEDPEEFEMLRRSLRSEIQPRGGYEEMIVEGIAANRWRLARLRRAETAMLISRREQLELRVRYPELGADGKAEALMVASGGLAAATDSPKKYSLIFQELEAVQESVEHDGFTPQGLQTLREVYGHCPTPAGRVLIRKFEEALEDSKVTETEGESGDAPPQGTQDTGCVDSLRETFLSTLSDEIDKSAVFYTTSIKLRTVEIPESKFEEQLILPEKVSERIMRYEVMLQKELERLQNQLLSWRRHQGWEKGKGKGEAA